MCSSNSLCISDEHQLVKLFEKFLQHRESLPLLEEDDPSKNLSNLTEEERKAREEAQAKQKEEEEKVKAEEEKKAEDEYKALVPLDRFNFDWAKKVDKLFHKEAEARLKINRLSK